MQNAECKMGFCILHFALPRRRARSCGAILRGGGKGETNAEWRVQNAKTHSAFCILHFAFRMNSPEYLVIITGLSGSGKSYVQSTLEDLGFYCSDNLPIALIEPFLEEVAEHQNASRVGIVVDVRTHDFATTFPAFYRERIQKIVPHAVLIFLE